MRGLYVSTFPLRLHGLQEDNLNFHGPWFKSFHHFKPSAGSLMILNWKISELLWSRILKTKPAFLSCLLRRQRKTYIKFLHVVHSTFCCYSDLLYADVRASSDLQSGAKQTFHYYAGIQATLLIGKCRTTPTLSMFAKKKYIPFYNTELKGMTLLMFNAWKF